MSALLFFSWKCKMTNQLNFPIILANALEALNQAEPGNIWNWVATFKIYFDLSAKSEKKRT